MNGNNFNLQLCPGIIMSCLYHLSSTLLGIITSQNQLASITSSSIYWTAVLLARDQEHRIVLAERGPPDKIKPIPFELIVNLLARVDKVGTFVHLIGNKTIIID